MDLLLYVWINEYKSISKQGFNLNSKYIINFDEKTEVLSIEDNLSYVENFFKLDSDTKNTGKVNDITALVGENGTSKSTFLEFLLNNNINKDKNSLVVYLFKNKIKYFFKNKIKIKSNTNLEIEYIKDFKANYNKPEIVYLNPVISSRSFVGNYRGIKNLSKMNFLDDDIQKFDPHNHVLSNRSYNKHINSHYFSGILRQITFVEQFIKKNDDKKDLLYTSEDIFKKIFEKILPFFPPKKLFIRLDSNYLKNILDRLNNDKDENKRHYADYIENIFTKFDKNKENISVEYAFINKLHQYFFLNSFAEHLISNNSPNEYINFIENSLKDLNDKINNENYFYKNEDIIFFLKDLSKEFYINKISNNEIKTSIYFLEEEIEEIKNNKLINLNKRDKIGICIDIADIGLINTIFKTQILSIFINVDWLNEKNNIIYFSTGEEIIFSIFASLYTLKNNLGKDNNDYASIKNYLLLIDESDAGLHPEWQRQFLKRLLKFLEHIFNDKKFQIIITSHSPFIVSELPKYNCIFLEKDEETNLGKISNKIEYTFAENIYSLFKSSFFMKSFIGDFASDKINKVIKDLNNNDLSISENRLDEIDRIINFIGEPILRNKLRSIFNSRKEITIDKKILELEKELEKLRIIKNDQN